VRRRTILCAPVMLAQPPDELALRFEDFVKVYNEFAAKQNTNKHLNVVLEYAKELSKRWRKIESTEGYPKDAIPKCKHNE
jgi:SMC interacting uncharacterized protein involved in chromosome segregation